MTYRNDLEAAHARIESLERENQQLVAEKERLVGENGRLRLVAEARQRDERQVHPATMWIVGIFGVFTAVIAAAVIVGY